MGNLNDRNSELEQEQINYDSHADYIVVRAEENGLTIMGLTRGKETKFHHNEKLDKGEVMIFQFTEHTSAIKVRGKATIYCRHGEVKSGF